MTDDESPPGGPILRHKPREKDFTPAVGESETAEAIEQHFATHIGEATSVFHELVSDLVHVDVHQIPPGKGRDHWVLFTTGMSDLPMTVPDGAESPKYAELMVSLPADWKLDEESFRDERWYWPVRWMKKLARLPHEYETWLSAFHTIPNGDPAEPFAPGTKLCCWMLLPSLQFPEEARVVQAAGREVAIYALHPLYEEEVTLKLAKGAEELLDKFDAAKVSEVIDPRRKPAVRRKLFGVF
jgi:hypothetical protein